MTDPYVLFEAGRVASQRSWESPRVIDVSAIQDEGPNGAPLIILTSPDGVTTEDARTIAALIGAGREAVIVCVGSLPENVAGWLPDGSIISADDARPDADQVTDSGTSASGQPYCHLRRDSPQWSEDPDEVRPARYFWDGFREDSPLWLQEGRRIGSLAEWFAKQPIRGGLGTATLRLIPTAVEDGPCLVTEVAVGRTTAHDLDDVWRAGFADLVLAYAEMPELHTRLGREAKDPLTMADLRTTSASVWKDVPEANRPERILRVVASGDPSRGAHVSLTYIVPVTEDFAGTRESLIRCTDSLVRVCRMIQDPATQLDGRRNPAAGLELVKLMNSVDLVPG